MHQNLLSLPRLDNFAAEHDQNPLGKVINDPKIVRNQYHRQFFRALQVFEEIYNLLLYCDIQGCCWLIRNQKLRFTGAAEDSSIVPETG